MVAPFFVKPVTSTRQPSQGSVLAKTSLTNALEFLWSGNEIWRNIITGANGSAAGNFETNQTITSQGISYFGSSTGSQRMQWPAPPKASSTSYTVFAYVNDNAGINVSRNPIDCDNAVRVFQLRFQVNDGVEFITFNTGGSPFFATSAGITWTAPRMGLLVGRINNNALSVWWQGKEQATGSATGTAQTVSGGSVITIAGSPNNGQGYQGGVLLAGLYNRALLDSEIVALSANPWQLFTAPRKKVWTPAAASGTIYTITPSGGIAFSGGTTLRRTHVQPVSGSIAFSGTAALRRTHVQPVSGGITFTGAVSLLRTRVQVPSGQVTFGGTAPITFVPAAGGTVYTITPSGGISFSGSASFRRTHVQTVSGGLSFAGAAPLIRVRAMVPSGSIVFGGAVPQIRTHVIVPSGQIVFSGSAGIVFIPAGSVTAVNLSRISMGLDRAHRLS